jgi:hypothetical protein
MNTTRTTSNDAFIGTLAEMGWTYYALARRFNTTKTDIRRARRRYLETERERRRQIEKENS